MTASAASRGMRQLAAAIEKEGCRVVAGLNYEDARRLVNVANNESCWLVSVDGAETDTDQWRVLEEVLAAKRGRNDRLDARNFDQRFRGSKPTFMGFGLNRRPAAGATWWTAWQREDRGVTIFSCDRSIFLHQSEVFPTQ